MEINAQLNYAHIAPRKMRLVTDMVKGRSVREAQLVLGALVRRGADPVLKLLKSAVANATNNLQLDESGLYVKDIKVNAGPVAKRMMPRAFGRGATIRKRMSRVVLVLAEHEGSRTELKAGKPKRTQDQPVVRDARVQDLKADAAAEETKSASGRSAGSREKREARSEKRGKGRGSFAPKIFQRKAI